MIITNIMATKVSYSLSEIRDALRKRVPDRVGMGLKTVFMTTKYGDVTVTDKYVQYPGNGHKFTRGKKSLEEYCGFVVDGVEKYSSPIVRIREMLNEMSSHKYDITAMKVLDFQTAHGRVLVDGSSVRYPGNPECYRRGTMTLQEWCAFVLDGIDRYSGKRAELKFSKVDVSGHIEKLSALHAEWVEAVRGSYTGTKECSAVLSDWMQSLRDIALMYSGMFGAGVESVQIEKVQSGVLGKYRKEDKTLVLDANLISWSSEAVVEIVLYQICRVFHARLDVGFWYALEQMSLAAGLIEGYGKVEEELYDQVREQGLVDIGGFNRYWRPFRNAPFLLFHKGDEPDIRSSVWMSDDRYYKSHRRLMNECWTYIMNLAEPSPFISNEDRKYLLRIGGVEPCSNDYRVYSAVWKMIGIIPRQVGELVGFSEQIIVLRSDDSYVFYDTSVKEYMRMAVEEVGTIIAVQPRGFVAIKDSRIISYDANGSVL